jgi:O-methyltransferase
VISEGKSQGIGGNTYYGYEDNLLDRVIHNFNSCGVDLQENSVELVKGLIDETMIIDGPVAFAHIDLDWFAPVSTALQRIVPWLSQHGSIILDDYHYYGGCRRAADEYFTRISDDFRFDDVSGAMKITRLRH